MINQKEVKSQAAIEKWISDYLIDVLELEDDKLDVNAHFDTFGIDSITMVEVSYEVGEWLGIEVNAKSLYKYPSISAVSEYLEGLIKSKNG